MDTPDKTVPRLNQLNDYLFLKVFGEKGDEEQLLGFLNAVLGRTGDNRLVYIEIIENKTFNAEIIGDKASVLDVRARTGDGTRANIEVQLRKQGNLDRRSLFYWSREYIRGLEAGQDYRELPDVIAINIVDFECFPRGDFHTCFHLWEDRRRDLLLTEALEIHFIDMVKFRRMAERDLEHDFLLRWLTFFDKESPEEVVAEVIQMDAAIRKAHERTVFVAGDKEALRAYEMREMALSDWTSGVNHALREGLREGELKILNLLKSGKSPEEILKDYEKK